MRRLLAVTFPDPVIVESNTAGWDFRNGKPLPNGTDSSFENSSNALADLPNYTLEVEGTPGAIPVASLAWEGDFTGAEGFTPGPFNILIPAGRQSTGLLNAVAYHTVIPSLTVAGTDAQGRAAWNWKFTGVTLPSYATGQSEGGGNFGFDQFQVDFDRVTCVFTGYSADGTALLPRTYSWDSIAHSGSSSAIVAPPATGSPTRTLEIGGQSIAIDEFSWALAEEGPGSVPSNFSVTLPSGSATAGLIGAIFNAEEFDTATIKTRDSNGRLIAQWTMGGAQVMSFSTSHSAGGVAEDTFQLRFGRIKLARYVYVGPSTQVADTYVGGWDFANKAPWTDPAGTPTLNGPSIPINPGESMQIDSGTAINIQSFNWGESTTFSINGGGFESPDRVVLSPVNVMLKEDISATGLLQNVAANTNHSTVTLIRRNEAGNEVIRYTLGGVTFTSLSVSAAGESGSAEDSIAISFRTITVEFTPYDSGGHPLRSVIRSWNQATNTGDPGSLTGTSFAPSNMPHIALDAGDGLIPVYAIDWNVSPQEPERHPPAITVNAGLGTWSPGIFAAAASHKIFGTVLLNTYDDSGNIIASWKLENVLLTSYSASVPDGGTGSESTGLSFMKITRTIVDASGKAPVTYAGGWDFKSGAAIDVPGEPSTLKGDDFAAGGVPEYTLAISGVTGLTEVQSFSWGDEADFNDPDFVPSVGAATLTLPGGGRQETGLIQAVAGSDVIPSVVIVRHDAQGRPVQRWTLNNVQFTSFQVDDETGVGGQANDTLTIDHSDSGRFEWLTYDAAGNPLPPIVSEWDLAHTSVTIPPYGKTFAPGTEPRISLEFENGEIALSSFSWGESFPGGGPDRNEAATGDFSFTALGSEASPALMAGIFDDVMEVSIITRDAQGHVLARWLLSGAHFDAYTVSGFESGGVPFNSFSMHVQKVQLTVNTLAPAVAVTPPAPATRNTAVSSLTIAFSEPVSGLDLSDLLLTRDGTVVPIGNKVTLTTSDGGRTWTVGMFTPMQSLDGNYSLTIDTRVGSGIVGLSSGQALAGATGASWTLDRALPRYSVVSFDYMDRPERVSVTFNEDVTGLTQASLIMKSLAGAPPEGSLPPINGFSYDSATRTAVWTFSAPLPDGNFSASLNTSSARDLAGNPLALPVELDFYVLGGDINRDRKVDFNDLVILAQNYNTSGKTYDKGDVTGDHVVDFNDLVVLAQHYNTGLPAPGAVLGEMAIASTEPAMAFDRLWAAALASPPAGPQIPAKLKKSPKAAKPLFSVTPVVKPAPAKPQRPAARH